MKSRTEKTPVVLTYRYCRACRRERTVRNGRFVTHWLAGSMKITPDGKPDGLTCPMSGRRAAQMHGIDH